MGVALDLVNQKFNRLTVIEKTSKRTRGMIVWRCLCDCGKYCEVPGTHLRNNNTKSCGCLNIDKIIERNVGQSEIKLKEKFGKLTVIENLGLKTTYGGKRRTFYLCQCECGNLKEISTNSLKTGNNTSCGCTHSIGEDAIKRILIENEINYKQECVDENLVSQYNRRLRFDFAIFNEDKSLNRYIEFNGKQHYEGWDKDTGFWTNGDSLEIIQERDAIKKKYCEENNIILKIIKYSDINKINIDILMSN